MGTFHSPVQLPTRAIPPLYNLEVSRGTVSGILGVEKFGRNSDVDSTEDVWDGGGLWAQPTADRIHNLASSSADDTNSSGTGMRSVEVTGISSGAITTETVLLDGVSNAATSNSYSMIHRMKGLTWGSGGVNAGTITATAVTDATVTAQINAGTNQTAMAIYQVPTGYTFYLARYYMTVNKATGGTYSCAGRILVAENGTNWVSKHYTGSNRDGNSHISHGFQIYPGYPADAYIKIQAADPSTTDLDVSAGFEGYLVQD